MPSTRPVPPLDLMDRVGNVRDYHDPAAAYDQLGERSFRSLAAALPVGWDWREKVVLDFGCGAGRVVRHLLDAAPGAEVWGCDIDEPSLDWLRANLCPPMAGAIGNGPVPPVDLPSGRFDLVYAVSVFTHLSVGWERWLLELHRLLTDGGVLLATFIGAGASAWVSDEPWDPERVGMSVSHEGQSWDLGGPMVRHSPWWIREHWGRLFEVVDVVPSGFGQDQPDVGHGLAVLRKTGPAVAAEALLAPGDDHRELVALDAEVGRRIAEVGALNARHRHVEGEVAALRAELTEATRQRDDAQVALDGARARVADLESSTSWRSTAPLRSLTERLRRQG